ncbi:hypothetical protein J1D01_08770 [Seonamhaeicola sp. NFXS20]|uniref:hypothetical protein n=1 Tax=Seonamhaeicola sp. NFXS20 TaxID=2816959 RepID=UPI003B8E00D5
MRLKLITVFLGTTTLLFGIMAGVLYVLINSYEETVYERELTIMSYQKVIDAMGRSNGISWDKLNTELTIDFNLGESGYNGFNNQYYYVLHPKNRKVNPHEMSNFMGLQLVFDQHKKLKTVDLYKP